MNTKTDEKLGFIPAENGESIPLICVHDGRTLLKVDSQGYVSINEQIVGHEPNLPECLKTLSGYNQLTILNTVDLSKPIQASFGNDKWDLSQEYHFIGLNRDSELVVEGFEDAEIQVAVAIRNTPEPEFKEGDKVWGLVSGLIKDVWIYGTFTKTIDGSLVINHQDFSPIAVSKIKPAINPDGTPNFPPFE